MDEQAKRQRVVLFESLCRGRGLPITVQRRAVLEAVLDLDSHPTADEVHAAVAGRMAGVSRTTIYRTLETLVQLGVITKTCHPGRWVRYDRQIEVHHHLVCLRCDGVMDIRDEHLDSIRIPDTSAQGFVVSDHRVQLRGVCRRCLEQEEES